MIRPLRAVTVVVVLLLPLVLMSCDGQAPSEPTLELDAVTAQLGSGNAGHAVTGSGTLWAPEPWNQWMIIPFTARQHQDGGVTGRWHHQMRTRKAGGRVIIEVECMSVVGNRAWLGGRSIYAMNDGNIGKFFGLHLIDNGEGRKAPVDQMTRSLWFGWDEQRMWDFCSQMPTDFEVWPLAGGNVQVR